MIQNRLNLHEAKRIVRQILAEKKSGGVKIRIAEGEVVDFQTGRETTADMHFLDFLAEKIPTLDVENPAMVSAVIKAIENNNSAEEVFKELERKGIVGRDLNSTFESATGQIQQIQTIMTSHWFTSVETLNEIKTTYAGGKGWLAGVGKLPVGDNPKGPYPSGGEVAHKIGNYKIKVRTKDIMKEPERPVVPGEEPRMDFIEDKKKKFACGILPYKGEGENIQFLIGKAPQGWWDLFKGKMDEGETEQETAKREFEEESSFKFKGSLDNAIELTHKKLKIWLVEMPELDAGQFDVSKVSKITGEYLNGRPEIEEIGWFGSTEAENKLNKKQMPFIGLAMEKLGGEVISESKEITKLRIFDFDETIAFTKAATRIVTPTGEEKSIGNQKWFDAYVKKRARKNNITAFDPIPELEKIGFKFDFSDYARVRDPKLNNLVVNELKRIVYKNRTEPTRGVYVMTARNPAAKQPIFDYLMSLEENGSPLFQESDFTEILTVSGGSKKAAIEELLAKHSINGETIVTEIAFWDDSQRNVEDVLELRKLYPNMKVDVNHVKHGKVVPLEEETLNERLGPVGYHVTNEKNWDSIIKTGVRGSTESIDQVNPEYGEKRVYFFSKLLQAKMAIFEDGRIIGNPDPPYIVIPINLNKVSGEKVLDPELKNHDIYGPNAYYLVGDAPADAVIASHIQHEDEFKNEKEDEKELKEEKMCIRIVENKRTLHEEEEGMKVGDLIGIIKTMSVAANNPKLKIIKALLNALQNFTNAAGEAAGDMSEMVEPVQEIIEFLTGFATNLMAAAESGDAESWKQVAENFFGDAPLGDVVKVINHPVIKKYIIEKFGEAAITEFLEEIIPMGKWLIKGVKFFSAMRRAKVDYQDIMAASSETTALTSLVKSIAQTDDNSATTAGFMGALNIKDEYTNLVKPKLQASFLEYFMGKLIAMNPTDSLSDADINISFKDYMYREVGARPEAGIGAAN